MTGKPAAKFRLEDRGIIEADYNADLVIFDPETIRDRATMEHPYEYPEGISTVIVNGKVAVEAGEWTGGRFGEVLRKKARSFFSW
jgi:N-acyl-D-aspartate/D-glutamate deacylase